MNRTPEILKQPDNNILLTQVPEIVNVLLEERGSGLSMTVGATVVVAGGALGGASMAVANAKPASAERLCTIQDPFIRVEYFETYNEDGSLDQAYEKFYCDDLPTTTAPPPPDTTPTTSVQPPTTAKPATTAAPTTQKPTPTTPATQKSTTTTQQQSTTAPESQVPTTNGESSLDPIYDPSINPGGDPDKDGVKNKDEAAIGTDPSKYDSNGDGVSDYDADADGGGTPNGVELYIDDTDPTDPSDDLAQQVEVVEVLGTATVNTSEVAEAPASTASETTIANDQSDISETTDSYVDSTNSGIDGTTAVVGGGVSGALILGVLGFAFKKRKRKDDKNQKPV